MLHEPFWINAALAEQIHAEQLQEHGGSDGVRDHNLLHSALARPEQIFAYDEAADLHQLAAAYSVGIAKNHPFVDGNKRTAFVVMILFLEINGFVLTAEMDNRYDMMIAVASGHLDEAELSKWLRENSVAVD